MQHVSTHHLSIIVTCHDESLHIRLPPQARKHFIHPFNTSRSRAFRKIYTEGKLVGFLLSKRKKLTYFCIIVRTYLTPIEPFSILARLIWLGKKSRRKKKRYLNSDI